MTTSHAIIPVRDFANTKIRLRTVLSESERAGLTSVLLDIVLCALERSEVTDVTVVATDPEEVEPKLKRFPKSRILKEVKRRGGVNSAVIQGMDSLPSALGNDFLILLIPSDLPFLGPEVVNEAISVANDADIVINPSRKRDGTSLLLMKPFHKIPLHYDDNSFVRHLDEALKLGLRVVVLDQNSFSFDVDDENDLALLKSEMRVDSFPELINELRKRSQ